MRQRGLCEQHDSATILDAFFSDYRGQFPNLAEKVKIIRRVEPSSLKLEREFSQITIILNRRRNRLQNKSLLQLIQGRNYGDFMDLVKSEKAST